MKEILHFRICISIYILVVMQRLPRHSTTLVATTRPRSGLLDFLPSSASLAVEEQLREDALQALQLLPRGYCRSVDDGFCWPLHAYTYIHTYIYMYVYTYIDIYIYLYFHFLYIFLFIYVFIYM